MKYNKIFVTGITGSGKSYLAERISRKLKVKAYALDDIYYKRKYDIPRTQKERKILVDKIAKKKAWIAEGGHTRDWAKPIVNKAELIIFLKTNTLLAKHRIHARYLERKMSKNDLKEKFSEVRKLSKKHATKRVQEDLMNDVKHRKKNIIILNNKKEINKFLKELKK